MENLKTTRDLMTILQVTRGTIHNWRMEGLPYIKVGTTVRFNLSEVNDWITERNGKRK